jgi:peptidoglycan/xylan/chitin deacetylase (PgdA/CDA1 family)
VTRALVLVVLLLASWRAQAEATRAIAITVDDLPWVEYALSAPADVHARHRRLLAALRGTHAIGFVNEDKLVADGRVDLARLSMLEDWPRAGLALGNHTFGHVGLHRTPLADYEDAIVRGERITRPLLARHAQRLEWFRHPFLQAGRDEEARAGLATFLAARGYRVAPVTVDNGDWIFARAYVRLADEHRDREARELRARYVDYMVDKVAYYERESRALFDREIAQVLLIHASALNADALPALLARLRARGYRFVPLEAAVRDPAYAHADGYRGGAGISWLHRWAMAESRPREFYAGEPVVPKDVMDLAGVESE